LPEVRHLTPRKSPLWCAKNKVEFAAAVQEMQEKDSVEDPTAACRHGKDASKKVPLNNAEKFRDSNGVLVMIAQKQKKKQK